jgi:hypothetical protein
MGHVSTPSEGLSTRNVFCIGPMVICACGLLLNPAKVPNFKYRAWLYYMEQKFHCDGEKTWESRFWDLAQWPTAIIRPKSQNSNIRHDGILSIGNFMLMINNHLNLKFRDATEIGARFLEHIFNLVFNKLTGQLKSWKMIIYHQHEISDRRIPSSSCLIFEFWDFGWIMAVGHKSQNRDSRVFSPSPWNFWSI